jgi:hypothetical protein
VYQRCRGKFHESIRSSRVTNLSAQAGFVTMRDSLCQGSQTSGERGITVQAGSAIYPLKQGLQSHVIARTPARSNLIHKNLIKPPLPHFVGRASPHQGVTTPYNPTSLRGRRSRPCNGGVCCRAFSSSNNLCAPPTTKNRVAYPRAYPGHAPHGVRPKFPHFF